MYVMNPRLITRKTRNSRSIRRRRSGTGTRAPMAASRLKHGYMYVVTVIARVGAIAEVGAPADAGEPDLFEPDHVHDPERVRVLDRPRGQFVAIRPVGARGCPAERAHVRGEVTGLPEGMLA